MAIDISAIQSRIPNAFDQALSGFRYGQQLTRQDEAQDLQRQQVEAQLQAQQAAREEQARMQAALQDFYSMDNPSLEDYERMFTEAPKFKDALMEPYKRQTAEQKTNAFSELAQLYNVLDSGNVDMAKRALDLRIEAAENSGKPDEAEIYSMAKQQIEQNPEFAKRMVAASMFGIDEGKAKDLLSSVGAAGRDIQEDVLGRKRYTDTGELVFPDVETPDAPSAREKFKLDQERLALQREEGQRVAGKMSAASEKALIEAQDAAQSSDAAVSELLSVAAEFENMPPATASGFAGKAREALVSFLGNEDDLTRIRKRYNAIKNNQVLQNLPPGVASDKDIEIAMSGFLNNTANPKTAAAFLRGLAKMEEINGQYNAFKADWISENGNTKGMFKAWKDQLKAENPSLDELSLEDLENMSPEQLRKLREQAR